MSLRLSFLEARGMAGKDRKRATKLPDANRLDNSSNPHCRCTREILSRPTGFPDLSRASPIASNQSKKGGYPWQTET